MKRRAWMFVLLAFGLSANASVNDNFNEIQIASRRASDDSRTCSNVDLRGHFGEVWDQQRTGFCYAAAVSDFLSFYTGSRISAPDIAVINLEQASGIEKALRKIILGKNLWSEGALPGMTMDRLARVGACKFTGYLTQNGKVLDFNETNRRLLNETISHSDSCASGARSKRFKIDYDIQGPGVVDGSTAEVLPAIDTELNKNRVAMMLYDSGTTFPGQPHGDHVSNIVGRRWNAKAAKCEYLIRNSWGKSFGENGYAWINSKTIERAASSIYTIKLLKTFKKRTS